MPDIEGDVLWLELARPCVERICSVSFHLSLLGPPRSSCELGDGIRGKLCACETFSNVIVHSISSPAKTVELFHCVETWMADMILIQATDHSME